MKRSNMYKELRNRRIMNWLKEIDWFVYVWVAPLVAFIITLTFIV